GYQATLSVNKSVIISNNAQLDWVSWEAQFCERADPYVSPFASQYDYNCWSSSGRTFTGQSYHFYNILPPTMQCISAYRLLDGITDAFDSLDEHRDIANYLGDKNLCENQKQFRLRCSNEFPTCIQVSKVGDAMINCPNFLDESITIHDITKETLLIHNLLCNQPTDSGCQLIRKHIIDSWTHTSDIHKITNTITKSERSTKEWRIQFREYCNTFWDMVSFKDEDTSFCQQWVCTNNEYKCLSGQCINPAWVCDGSWDCSDASDEQGIFMIIEQLSLHNQIVLGDISKIKERCFNHYKHQPFSNICNITHEFPCLLANVLDPLNIIQNRPCIDLKQIGDGVQDCFNNLDERNIVTGCVNKQKGFDVYCQTEGECIYYTMMCNKRCPNPFDDSPICSLIGNGTNECPNKYDAICLNKSCIIGARCNGIIECPNGEDEYWCSSHRNDIFKAIDYRLEKLSVFNQVKTIGLLPEFPPAESLLSSSSLLQSFSSENISLIDKQVFHDDDDETVHYPFICNKGVQFADHMSNKYICFCPPSY
ncbi:unnamed protein product, partial [Adineta ricciae]